VIIKAWGVAQPYGNKLGGAASGPLDPRLRAPPGGAGGAGSGRGVHRRAVPAGRSLRELAELTDRSFSAVRNILTRRGVHRRTAGAAVVRESDA
jgi:hypothetical protein